MPVTTVARFNVTPVKSTALQHPDAIDLQPEGAVGDRRFLFARPDGTRLTGISKAPLIPIAATWLVAEEHLTMRLPDGTVTEGSTVPFGEPVGVKLFDRTVPARPVDPAFETIVRAVDETLTLFRVEEPEYAGGSHRASVVSLASIADVGSRGGDPGLDPRRFRMLIELDGLDPYEEDTWRARRIRVGHAIVRLGERIPRCAMTSLAPDTGEKDFDTLGVLAGHRRIGAELLLGVYGDVEEPGRIERGDAVELLS